MGKTYNITVFCNRCQTRFRYQGSPDEQPPCPGCDGTEDPAKLARITAALEAFEMDPAKQAAICEIRKKVRAAVERGEDPFPDN